MIYTLWNNVNIFCVPELGASRRSCERRTNSKEKGERGGRNHGLMKSLRANVKHKLTTQRCRNTDHCRTKRNDLTMIIGLGGDFYSGGVRRVCKLSTKFPILHWFARSQRTLQARTSRSLEEMDVKEMQVEVEVSPVNGK